MKAAVYTSYGGPQVLRIENIEKPSPKTNELLIWEQATAVNSGDSRLRRADPWAVRLLFGLFKPRLKVLGGVFAGEVDAIGSSVTRFKVGDKVFGMTGMRMGTYAEYVRVPESGAIALMPKNLRPIEAATIPFGGNTALYFLRKAEIAKAQKVLVYGASGAVGSAAVQLAKHFGANVTGVCSATHMELVMSLGADHVIDYTKEDMSTHGEVYDVVYETVNKLSVSTCIKLLNSSGKLILGAAMMSEMLQARWATRTGDRKMISGVVDETAENIAFLKELIEQGELKPVIDRTYPLERIVEAHTYVDAGHKAGNVAIGVTDK